MASRHAKPKSSLSVLTDRELEVLAELAAGRSNAVPGSGSS
jgi:DNA-binding CsgD family transcriptional regulator